jgi:aminoglycoside phosphotransferase (APT) family kinase protein
MAEGIDVARVTTWLRDHIDGVSAPFSFELIPGGRSNLTFAVTDAVGRRLVLRRPPMSHVLSTAHDMGREHRIISALQATAVPVPTALGYCADETVCGQPFYVMNFVDGHVLRDTAETEAILDQGARKVAGDDLVDVLVAIHDVDVDAVGLGGLARRDGYIERQLRRWHGQFEQSQRQAREVGVYRAVPLVGEVHRLLMDRMPAQRGAGIVHGDYRIDNTVMSAEGRVRAVLDWELSTLGDPLADVGTVMAYWAEHPVTPSLTPATAQFTVTTLRGFPSRAEVAARYADRSGRDLADLGFYVAFAYWKLACILEGVYVRYAARAMGTGHADADADVLGPGVEARARRAMDALCS